MRKDDASLVRAVLDGDREAYGFLVERYAGAVAAAAFARAGDREAARDIAQEAFAEGYARLGTLNRPERFGAWLYGIAAHKAVSWVRRRIRERQTAISARGEAQAGGASPVEAAEQREDISRVHAALERLAERDREIILLRYESELERREAAELLGLSPEAVDKRLQRAMKRLRSELGEEP